MAEYIEREKIIKLLNDNIVNAAVGAAVNGHSEEYFDGWTDATSSAIMGAERIPTADVAPVIHAKWVTGEYTGTFEVGTGIEQKTVYDPVNFRCSNCGNKAGIPENFLYPCNQHVLKYPYCPQCGAKMDKEG